MKKVLVCLVVVLALAVSAEASLMTFTHEGNGSGTLGGISFPESDFVITAFGDIRVQSPNYDYIWRIYHSSASIWIDGVGEFDFLTETETFVNQERQIVGFSVADSHDLFNGPTDSQFATWDMQDPIGPISGMGKLFQFNGACLLRSRRQVVHCTLT